MKSETHEYCRNGKCYCILTSRSSYPKEFSLNIKVVIQSFSDFQKTAETIPSSWTNDTEQKTNVLFLWDEVNKKEVLNELIIKPEIDNVQYINCVICCSTFLRTPFFSIIMQNVY